MSLSNDTKLKESASLSSRADIHTRARSRGGGGGGGGARAPLIFRRRRRHESPPPPGAISPTAPAHARDIKALHTMSLPLLNIHTRDRRAQGVCAARVYTKCLLCFSFLQASALVPRAVRVGGNKGYARGWRVDERYAFSRGGIRRV